MRLTITSIETIPIRVDLNRTYKGSHYKMPRRCTIITRVHTAEGVIGQRYNADWDEEQAAILKIIHHELEQIVVGQDAFVTERCWESMYRTSVPHGTFVEAFAPERDPGDWHMLANPPVIKDGQIRLPEGPGFGLLDGDFVKKYWADT